MASESGVPVLPFNFFTSRLDPFLPRRLTDTLSGHEFDLVHLHGARAAFHAIRSSELSCRPIVYTPHGYHFAHHRFVKRIAGAYAERKIAHSVHSISFVSQADRAIAQRYNLLPAKLPTAIIYNGVNAADLPPPAASRPYDVIFAARMHHQKNPVLAAHIIAELAKQGCRTAIIGDGPLQTKVIDVLEVTGSRNAVEVMGALSRTETLKFISQAKILLMPSLWEGLPILPLEAMFLGAVVVASDIPGTDETVRHGTTGLLINNATPAAYYSAILDLLRRPEALASFAKAATTEAHRLFNREANSRLHEARYDNALAGHRRS